MPRLLFCICGVRGGDLKHRIETIMTGTHGAKLTCAGRAALAIAAIVSVAAPVVVGALTRGPRAMQTETNVPRFDVASVKRNMSGTGPYQLAIGFLPAGRVQAVNAPLVVLVASAYGVSHKEIDDSGAELQGMYDLDARAGIGARAPDGSAESSRELRLMLQSLLAERFKLKVRKETRDLDVYALVVAPGGARLTAAPANRPCDAPCGGVSGGPAEGLRGRGAEIADLVKSLTYFQDRQIVDRTGLRGRFDIDVPPWHPFTLPPANSDERQPDPSAPSLFTVMQERLGLKLESVRAPRDIYIVDNVEPLSEN